MKPLSIHILTTILNKDRQISILSTWLSDFTDYVFYTDFSTEIGNQIELTTNTNYDSNGEKHILEVNRIFREKLTDKYEWFYFCDDDTVPNINAIINYSKSADTNVVHAHSDHCWPEDRTLLSISGGAGYLVHSSILSTRKPPKLKKITWSDVQFALWLRENKISIKQESRFKWDVPSKFDINISEPKGRNIVRDHFSFHYVKDHDLRSKIWEIYTTPKEQE